VFLQHFWSVLSVDKRQAMRQRWKLGLRPVCLTKIALSLALVSIFVVARQVSVHGKEESPNGELSKGASSGKAAMAAVATKGASTAKDAVATKGASTAKDAVATKGASTAKDAVATKGASTAKDAVATKGASTAKDAVATKGASTATAAVATKAPSAAKDAVASKNEHGDCTLNFPDNHTYGKIFVLSKGASLNNSGLITEKHTDARGKIAIKAGERIMFRANAYLALQPEVLASLPPQCMKALILRDLEFSDQSLSYAKNLTNLEHLDLKGTDITDASFKTITDFPQLQYLSLISTSIDGSGFSALVKLPNLRSLRVSANALKHFKDLEELQQVRFLDISQSGLSDADLLFIGKMSNLDHLEIRKTAITNKGMLALKGLKHLLVLDVRETKVSCEGIAQLAGVPIRSLCFDGATKADQKALSIKFPGIQCGDRDVVREEAPTMFAPLH
jgi:hypothetical protein